MQTPGYATDTNQYLTWDLYHNLEHKQHSSSGYKTGNNIKDYFRKGGSNTKGLTRKKQNNSIKTAADNT